MTNTIVPELTTSNSITISGFSANTTYTYTLKSREGSNKTTTTSGTFTTLPAGPILDLIPDAFAFAPLVNAPVSTVETSNIITIAGMSGGVSVPVSVSGGQYIKNGGAPTSIAGTASNGDTFAVSLTSSASNSTVISATLNVGGVTGTYAVTTLAGVGPPPDLTPDAFFFAPVTGAPTSSVQTSNTITVSGMTAGAAVLVTVTIAFGGTFSKNGGAFTSASTMAQNGDTFAVRLTSAAGNSTPESVTLTIGGVSGTYTVTTTAGAVDNTPNAFSFTPVTNAVISTVSTSNTITVSGMDTGVSTAVSITGGTYSKNGGSFVSSAGTALNGDTFAVRLTSSASNSTAVSANLTIGGIVGTYTVTTAAAVGTSATTLNPSDKAALSVLSNGNLTMDVGANGGVPVHVVTRSVTHQATGGPYLIETLVNNLANNVGVGIATSIFPLDGTYIGQDANSVGYFNDGFIGYAGGGSSGFATFGNGAVIGTLWNPGTGAVSFYKDGTLIHTVDASATINNAFFAVDMKLQGDQSTSNFGATTYAHAVGGAGLWPTTSTNPAIGGGVVDDRTLYASKRAKIGGSGWLVGSDVAPDGTWVCRADTFGAYVYNTGTVQWDQIATTTRFPASENYIADGGSLPGVSGCYEIRVAPSDSTRIYAAMGDGRLYTTSNRGATWTRTAWTPIGGTFQANTTSAPDPGVPWRVFGEKMAVDPANKDALWVGVENNHGLWFTMNGGATWSLLSSAQVPLPSGSNGGSYNIVFDSSGGTVVVGGATRTANMFVCSQQSGIYKSVDGGVTFTVVAGSPTCITHACCDSTGRYYCTSRQPGRGAYRLVGSTWTLISNRGDEHSIAVDSLVANRIAIGAEGGNLAQSLNNGTTMSIYSTPARVATDITWLAWTNEVYMTNGNILFHPTIANTLLFSQGIGCWKATLPTTTPGTLTWTSVTLGIEQFVCNLIIHPPGQHVMCFGWDRSGFILDTPDVFPSTHMLGPDFNATWHGAYCKGSPAHVVIESAFSTWVSGYSTDGGATFTNFPGPPQNPNGYSYGQIAIDSVDPNRILLQPNTSWPRLSTDNGLTWNLIHAMPGLGTTEGVSGVGWGEFSWATYIHTYTIIADPNNGGVFYADSAAHGLYKSTNGGLDWTNVNASSRGFAHTKLYGVRGQNGHLWHVGGQVDGGIAGTMDVSINGGVSFVSVPNVAEVYDMAFGKATVGNTYGWDIYFIGYVHGVFGFYRSSDLGTHAAAGTLSAATFHMIADPYPFGWLDIPFMIEANKDIDGTVYFGMRGSGAGYISKL